MRSQKKEKVLVGNTTFTLKGGKIVEISREGSTFTTKDDHFQGSVNYAIILATSKHQPDLLGLVERLNPGDNDCTYNAIMILKECILMPQLSDAIDVVLGKTCKASVSA